MDDTQTDDSQDLVNKTPTHFRHHFTKEEDLSIWRFLIDVDEVDSVKKELERYKTATNTPRTVNALMKRYRYSLGPNLHTMDFDDHTKMTLYCKYAIPIDPMFLAKMRNTMDIALNEAGNIVVDFQLREPASVTRQGQKRTGLESSGPLIPLKQVRFQEDPEENYEQEMDTEVAIEDGSVQDEPQVPPAEREYVVVEQLPPIPMLVCGKSGPIKTELKPYESDEQVGNSDDSLTQQMEGQEPFAQFDIRPLFDLIKESINETTKEALNSRLDEILRKSVPVPQELEANKKNYLIDLKHMVSNLNSPVMSDIENRIENALQTIDGNQNEVIPMENIRAVLDIAMKMIGY